MDSGCRQIVAVIRAMLDFNIVGAGKTNCKAFAIAVREKPAGEQRQRVWQITSPTTSGARA
jgi:hypothetical protein